MKSQIPMTRSKGAVLRVLCVWGFGFWILGFDSVRTQDHPLPDADKMFHAVRENLVRAERETHLYLYKERRTDIHTNPFGKLGTGGTSLFEVYPSPARRLTYRRLIQKDGTSVPAAQVAQQDQRYRTRVAEVQKETSARGPADPRVLEGEAQRARDRRQRAVDDVVGTLSFQMKGRTTHRGLPVVAIQFAGKPSAQPVTRQGRIAQKFNGTLFIDEKLNEVIYLEATSTGDISFGFGVVAKLGQGTVVTLTRQPVEGNLWMPTRLTMKGRGRALLVRSLVIDFSIDWLDYDRLPVESLAPFVDSRIQSKSGSRP